MNTKQLARFGLFSLKEATLNILLQARREGKEPLTVKEIRERLGIPKAPDRSDRPEGGRGESLMWGILLHLENEERVDVCQEGRRAEYKWKITEHEASLLSELSDDNL